MKPPCLGEYDPKRFGPPETIATARLVLRRPQAADAAAIHEYASDPEVTRYMEWRRHTSPAEAVAFVEWAARCWESGEEYAWVVTVKPDDRAVGGVACRVRGHAVDIGYVLARGVWGRGYATEAARAIVEWALSLTQVDRVWATCDVENLASVRVLDKLGMSREGVLRRHAIRPNLPPQPPRDAFVHARVREPATG